MKEKRHICDWKEGKTVEKIILIQVIWHVTILLLCFGIICSIANKLGVGYSDKIEYPEETYRQLEKLQEVYIKEGEFFDYMGLRDDYRVDFLNYGSTGVEYGEYSNGIKKIIRITLSSDYRVISSKRNKTVENWDSFITARRTVRNVVVTIILRLVIWAITACIMTGSKDFKRLEEKQNMK